MEPLELKDKLHSVLSDSEAILYNLMIEGVTIDNHREAMRVFLNIRGFTPMLQGVDLVTVETVEVAGVNLSKKLKKRISDILLGGEGTAIPAIKLLRTEIEGLSLREAKEVIDEIRYGLKKSK